jgi:hypothetical protein
MPGADLQSAGLRAHGELTLAADTRTTSITLPRRRAACNRSRTTALHDARGAGGAIGGGGAPSRGGVAVATKPAAVVPLRSEAGVMGDRIAACQGESENDASTPRHLSARVPTSVSRPCCRECSELRVEPGVADGLVPVDVEPAGDMRQQLGQLHGVPGATAAAPARTRGRSICGSIAEQNDLNSCCNSMSDPSLLCDHGKITPRCAVKFIANQGRSTGFTYH